MSIFDEIPWDALRARAQVASSRSYAPYSKVMVGAAGYTSDGKFVEGSNVENASFGLTLCAECSLVSDLIRTTSALLVAIAIVAGDQQPLTPCGRCRQVLFEHGGADLLIDQGVHGPARRLADLLPEAFGPGDLAIRRTP